MTDVLAEIFRTSRVTDNAGKEYELHSHTSAAQCSFLDGIIREVQPQTSLEVGLAYGISALQILKTMSTIRQDFTHIVMDPFQSEWHNIGLLNIERSGYNDHVHFHSDFSTRALPKLAAAGTRIQFAYIDSTKVFDLLMVDVHYITEMLDIGGVLVLDDCDYPGIRLLARFLSKHPSYKVMRGMVPDRSGLAGRAASSVANVWLRLTPFRKRKLSRIDLPSDAKLDVAYKCIAFKKVLDDARPWHWHQPF